MHIDCSQNMGTILSKAKNTSTHLSVKLGKKQFSIDKGFEIVCELRENLFLNKSHKADKCQFLNLGSHFTEDPLGVCYI